MDLTGFRAPQPEPRGQAVSSSDVPDQIPLFDDDSAAGPVPSPQPWRTTPADAWRAEAPPSASALEQASPDLRLRALGKLDPGRLRKVMAAEPRVRIRDIEIEHTLSMAEFELAEERDELVEFELPAWPDAFGPSGLLGADIVEALVQAHMEGMKAEQARRPQSGCAG